MNEWLPWAVWLGLIFVGHSIQKGAAIIADAIRSVSLPDEKERNP